MEDTKTPTPCLGLPNDDSIVNISGGDKPFCRSHQVWKKFCLQAESGDTKTTGSAIALF
jgi:hypothetical protein